MIPAATNKSASRTSPAFAPRALRCLLLTAIVTVGLAWASARPASAYPQFQFSSGTQRCGQCHYSPAGFGLLTSWGRDESADTISRGGDGSFLHGAWTPPAWLALGGDVRLAATDTDVGGPAAPELAAFPMQTELYARAAFGDTGISFYVAGGIRGTSRRENSGLFGHLETAISREHYLMWKPSASGPYARVGRFYAPYGLRLVEHIFYVRRFTGYGLYEETYNVSGGYLAEEWEVHATAFTPPPASFPDALNSVGQRGSGGAIYGEKRFASMGMLGAQGRVAVNAEQRLIEGGLVGKIWVDGAKMLAMGELDLQRTDGAGSLSTIDRNSLVSFLGLSFFPIRGVMAMLAAERYQEDLRVESTAHNAVDLEINLFPWAHVELVLLGRYQIIGSGSVDGAGGSLGMLQLHYYL